MSETPQPECDTGRAVQAVLFDVDGTLVDTNDLHAAAWREAFLAFGHDVPTETIRFQVGKGGDNLVPALLPDVTADEQAEMEASRGELFKRNYMPRAVPFPGVRPLFEALVADGVKVVLASSSSKAEVRYYLAMLGVEDLVFAFTSKDDVESSKPCPDIFEAALRTLAPLTAEDAIVVGDSPWDVKAATAAGLRTLAFRSGGFEDEVLRAAGACALYDGPEDLLDRYSTSLIAAREAADAL
jgi:HAD superfamily hydrolase (TIGR01509 family)